MAKENIWRGSSTMMKFKLPSTNARGQEVFTLDEGSVTISYPDNLSSASLKDLKDYLDIFYRKACRLTDDPHDPMLPLENK